MQQFVMKTGMPYRKYLENLKVNWQIESSIDNWTVIFFLEILTCCDCLPLCICVIFFLLDYKGSSWLKKLDRSWSYWNMKSSKLRDELFWGMWCSRKSPGREIGDPIWNSILPPTIDLTNHHFSGPQFIYSATPSTTIFDYSKMFNTLKFTYIILYL